MSIKDMPHVTVEQILALRKKASETEQELAALKASLPKIKADAVREYEIPDMDNDREWLYINDDKNKHANKLEVGE